VIRLSESRIESRLGVEFTQLVARTLVERYKISREASRDELQRRYGKKVLFAHEILMCSYKRELRSLIPELDMVSSFKPKFIVGEIVERGVEEFMAKLGFKKVEKICVMEFDNLVVAGSPDYASEDWRTVVDVKYSTSPKMREHHLKRVQMYMTLCGSERGALIYISPRGVISYETGQPMSGKEIVFHATSWMTPKWQWECDYCDFKEFCNIRVHNLRRVREVRRGEG
jgi:CRISPR/Cas system-associated exonuclease Cas4 (RecB family)